MKIGIDARMFSSKFTGIGRYTYELIQHLLDIDQTNTYVLFFNAPEYETCPFVGPRVKKVLVDAKHYSLQEQTKFLSLLWKEKLDLMHFTHFNAPILYKRPSIVTIHDLTLSFFPGKKMTSLVHRLGYNLTVKNSITSAKGIIAVSENTKKDIQSLYHIPSERIRVIYEAADGKFSAPVSPAMQDLVRTTYGLNKPFFLYTGVWRDHKNVVGMLNAFSLLLKEGLDANLVITGKEDPSYPEVKETIAALGLTEQVKLVGLVPEEHLMPLYTLARTYVFPSFYEGFGLPPLEAFAAGTPVACSNTSSLPEICGEGNALFFDPRDTQAMANAMRQVFTDESLRANLISRGKQRIQEFSWKKMAEETLEMYQTVLTSSQR